MIVFTHFDEDDFFVLSRPFEDDLILAIHGQDGALVVGEVTLKGGEFGQRTRSFGYSGLAMELPGFFYLEGVCPVVD